MDTQDTDTQDRDTTGMDEATIRVLVQWAEVELRAGRSVIIWQPDTKAPIGMIEVWGRRQETQAAAE